MIKIQITSDGLEDLKAGFLFYEAQEVGLGEYFSHSLKSDIEGLRVTGGAHRLAYKDYRRALSPSIPLCDLLHHGCPDRNNLGHH